jgi:hypothetical protein
VPIRPPRRRVPCRSSGYQVHLRARMASHLDVGEIVVIRLFIRPRLHGVAGVGAAVEIEAKEPNEGGK